MSYTPGPWTVRETKDGMTIRKNRRRLEVVAPCPDGGEMVIVGKHTGLDCLRSANAQLIASAPDLLEACQTALENLAPSYSGDHLVMRRLRAAIAKAEGREGQ